MNVIKSTIKLALVGTALSAMSLMTSCSCGSEPEPAPAPVYVAPAK